MIAQTAVELECATVRRHPIDWSSIVAGALASTTATLLFALCAVAASAHQVTPEHHAADVHTVGATVIATVVAATFFSFVIGGWVAARCAGFIASEPAMVQGAVTWLVALPIRVRRVALWRRHWRLDGERRTDGSNTRRLSSRGRTWSGTRTPHRGARITRQTSTSASFAPAVPPRDGA